MQILSSSPDAGGCHILLQAFTPPRAMLTSVLHMVQWANVNPFLLTVIPKAPTLADRSTYILTYAS